MSRLKHKPAQFTAYLVGWDCLKGGHKLELSETKGCLKLNIRKKRGDKLELSERGNKLELSEGVTNWNCLKGVTNWNCLKAGEKSFSGVVSIFVKIREIRMSFWSFKTFLSLEIDDFETCGWSDCGQNVHISRENGWKLKSHLAIFHFDDYRPWRCKHCDFPDCFHATEEEAHIHSQVAHPDKRERVSFS
jgi:hypothetical protein